MAYEIVFTDLAVKELNAQRAYDFKRIVEEIEKQLKYQPSIVTRNRKCLEASAPEFEYDPPIWELRVGDFRVFYDANEENQKVTVRAIRKKAHGQTTGDLMYE